MVIYFSIYLKLVLLASVLSYYLGILTANYLQPVCRGKYKENMDKHSILVCMVWEQLEIRLQKCEGWEHIEISLPNCSSLQVISFPVVQLHLNRTAMRASQKDFENAMNQVKLLKKDPGNEVKLKLYSLYKQVNAYGLTFK